jgi:hypothetical protein
MSHDRDIHIHNSPYGLGDIFTTLELHCFSPPFLDQAAAIQPRLAQIYLVGEKRQISYHKSFRPGPDDSPGMIENLIHSHRQGIIVTRKDNTD